MGRAKSPQTSHYLAARLLTRTRLLKEQHAHVLSATAAAAAGVGRAPLQKYNLKVKAIANTKVEQTNKNTNSTSGPKKRFEMYTSLSHALVSPDNKANTNVRKLMAKLLK